MATMEELLWDAQWIDTPDSRRSAKRALKYGITPLQFEMMGHRQEWKCAGCGGQFPEDLSGVRVDHCHASGIVRGLLCHPCNIALGWARDNSETLRNLADYLEAN